MSKFRLIGGGLLASAAFVGLHAGVAQAADDAFMKMAKDYIAEATAPVTKWDGPTTGPKAQGKKLVVYVSTDQRNGGAQGVGDGAAEAAKAIGWDFRILDGQGTVPGRTSAMAQAIALKADGIILGSPDAVEQAPEIEEAVKAGIKVVGWHSGPGPGKIEANPNVFTNITTDPNEVAKASGLYAVVDFGRHGRRDPLHRQHLRDRDREDERGKGGDRRMLRLQGSGDRGHSDRRSCQPHAATNDFTPVEIWQGMDLFDRRQRPLLRLLGAVPVPRLESIPPSVTRARSPQATARCRRSSASAPSSTNSRPSPSRCICMVGSASTK